MICARHYWMVNNRTDFEAVEIVGFWRPSQSYPAYLDSRSQFSALKSELVEFLFEFLNRNTPIPLLFWRRPQRWLNVVLSLRLEDVAGELLHSLQISF